MSRCACYPPASSACPAGLPSCTRGTSSRVCRCTRSSAPARRRADGTSHQPSRTIREHTHTIAYNEPVDTGVPCRVRNSQQPSPIRVIVTPCLLRSISGLTPARTPGAGVRAVAFPAPGERARAGAPAPPSVLPLALGRGPIELARACRRLDRGPTCGEVATIVDLASPARTRSSRPASPAVARPESGRRPRAPPQRLPVRGSRARRRPREAPIRSTQAGVEP